MRLPTLAACSLLAAITFGSAGRAAANTCQTDQLLPAQTTLPAGCPLHVYARLGQGLTMGAVTAARGGGAVEVGTAGGPRMGSARVLYTRFDRAQCGWRDEVEEVGFDVYRVEVASQAGDVLSFGSPFTVEVGPAGPCPDLTMSWQPACAEPLPPPSCLPDGDAGIPCDGGIDPPTGALGHEHEGGCAAGGGAGGPTLIGAIGAALLGLRRRRG